MGDTVRSVKSFKLLRYTNVKVLNFIAVARRTSALKFSVTIEAYLALISRH